MSRLSQLCWPAPYVVRVRRPLLGMVAIVVSVAIGGCTTTSDRFTGVVTTTAPSLCLGAPAASGDCFVATAQFIEGLRLNDCVTVVYRAADSPLPGPRGTVTAVEPSSDC